MEKEVEQKGTIKLLKLFQMFLYSRSGCRFWDARWPTSQAQLVIM